MGAAAASPPPFHGTAWNTARALLEAASAGDAATTLALGAALGAEVLGSPLIALALRAQAGDPLAAIDLARLVYGDGDARAQVGS